MKKRIKNIKERNAWKNQNDIQKFYLQKRHVIPKFFCKIVSIRNKLEVIDYNVY